MRIFYVNYDVKNEKISIKFENGNTKVTINTDEQARDEFYEVLKKLNDAIYRILRFSISMRRFIIASGAKFIYDDVGLKKIQLLGYYKMDNDHNYLKLDVPVKYYSSSKPFVTFTDKEKELISKLIEETKKYIQGERQQLNLNQAVDKPKDVQPTLSYSVN